MGAAVFAVDDGDECPDGVNSNGVSDGFASIKTSQRLNQIDTVRALGVGDHIDLPQLVVCGDQSSGKSSVLEGISGIPFPRKDGLCTRFSTEIVLRHDPRTNKRTATLIPCQSRTAEEKELFAAFRRDFDDYAELPEIIQEASDLMNLRSLEFPDGPAFATDVLRLEVVGNTGLHLTLVDLPGLISVGDDNDIHMVRSLVDNYLESSRTIILAVIPATSDAETQLIIQRAQHFDTKGDRTIGIITKPDLINKGTEERVACLAKNQDRTQLQLGFFLLKNPSPEEIKVGVTPAQRDQAESEFFSEAAWKAQGLDISRVGIKNLRPFLQELLDRHIERELPKVRGDISRLLKKVEAEIDHLGPERSQAIQIRMFLTRVSSNFQSIIKGALNGMYDLDEVEFSSLKLDTECHLRAAVHLENQRFADFMRMHSRQRRLISDTGENSDDDDSARNTVHYLRYLGSRPGDTDDYEELVVTEKQMLGWVKEMYHKSRGRELPGNYNDHFLRDLFHVQSASWGRISRSHVDIIVALVTLYLESVLHSLLKEPTVRGKIWRIVKVALDQNVENCHKELATLLRDEQGYPITYNHYYTDNIQKTRLEKERKSFEELVRSSICKNTSISQSQINNLVKSLQMTAEVNMVDQACSDALTALNAYYKVAMKTFVDNVCRQVIERHLLAPLPRVFNPTLISSYSDEYLVHLAAESPKAIQDRIEALKLQEALKQSIQELSL
ncbi:Dynamin family protein [Penicillium malachiteum]|uniref:Dynamin family protein n=1 Tax=Penicillium malachiteum TaxID=1324776 RepID=A0AAD6MUI3_9EURO|nr:Dynamin family protein [Penicillium malachiteum]